MIPVNLATRTAGLPINLDSGFFVGVVGVAIAPDGKSLLVLANNGVITTIATATRKVVRTVKGPEHPVAFAIMPNGRTAYVVSGAKTVWPVSLPALRVGAPISVGPGMNGIAIAPDGRNAYVTTIGVRVTITPINTATNTAGQTITATASVTPLAVVVSPDGATIYVETTGNDGRKWNNVMSFDRSTKRLRTMTTLVATGTGVFDELSAQMAITPDQAPVAVLSVVPAAVGAATRFSAAGSAGPTSPIVSYRWNFGDGKTVTTKAPTTRHIYRSAKTYTASVTETDKAGTSTQKIFTGQTMSRNGGPSATATATVVIS